MPAQSNDALTTIETARLTLRPFAPSDQAAYAAIRAKPSVVRWLPGGAQSAQQAEDVAERTIAHFSELWRRDGYGPWAVIEQASGRLVGHAGLRRLPEIADAAGNPETEILFMLDDTVWRQGYATEAALVARDHAFGPLDLPRVIGMALPDNAASCRVLEKAGLVFERMIRFAGLDVAYHARNAR